MWKTALKKFEVIWPAYVKFFKGFLPQVSFVNVVLDILIRWNSSIYMTDEF